VCGIWNESCPPDRTEIAYKDAGFFLGGSSYRASEQRPTQLP
jgi:hypothetical protein